MTPELIRFIQNTQAALRGFTARQLYHLAVSMREELARRQTDALPEADALVAALLADARAERKRIFGTDCTEHAAADHSLGRPCVRCEPGAELDRDA